MEGQRSSKWCPLQGEVMKPLNRLNKNDKNLNMQTGDLTKKQTIFVSFQTVIFQEAHNSLRS